MQQQLPLFPFPPKKLPQPPHSKNNKIIRYDEPLHNSPDPQAINKNIIGATQQLIPKNGFPQHPPLLLLLLLQQQFCGQHG